MLRILALTCFMLIAAGSDLFAATISGRALDSVTLEPVVGANVRMSRGIGFFTTVAEMETGDDGRYAFTIPFSDRYQISAGAEGYFADTRVIDLTADVDVEHFDLLLDRPASMIVRIFDRLTGAPVVGSVIFARLGGSGIGGTSDESGTVVFDSIRPGDYAVCAIDVADLYRNQCAPEFLLPFSDSIDGAPTYPLVSGTVLRVELGLVAGAEISGQITSTVGSVSPANRSMNVKLVDALTGEIVGGTLTTGAAGSYRIGGLPDGAYYVTMGGPDIPSSLSFWWNRVLYPAIPCNSTCNQADGTAMATTAAMPVRGIDFVLSPGAVVRGLITSAVDGTQLEGVEVRAYDADFLFGPLLKGVAITGPDGRYELAGLNPQIRHSLGTRNAIGYVNEQWPDLPCILGCTDGVRLDLVSGLQTQDYDFMLSPGMVFSGLSLRASDQSPVDARIYLFDSSGAQRAQHRPLLGESYLMPALPPGEYFLLGTMQLSGLCVDYLGNRCTATELPPGAQLIDVTDPGAMTFDLQFPIDIFVSGFE